MKPIEYDGWRSYIPDTVLYKYDRCCATCQSLRRLVFGTIYLTFPDANADISYQCINCLWVKVLHSYTSAEKQQLGELCLWLLQDREVTPADITHPNRLIRAEVERRLEMKNV